MSIDGKPSPAPLTRRALDALTVLSASPLIFYRGTYRPALPRPEMPRGPFTPQTLKPLRERALIGEQILRGRRTVRLTRNGRRKAALIWNICAGQCAGEPPADATAIEAAE